ncbi:hypothetical protein V8G54_000188 (mitochondrion) [Vigna mungo]|uniref:Uncharacterized protein n=1 Tax=Vigna mungo TaxID=3915 RepID=A0AAQ3PDF8_VIGMU
MPLSSCSSERVSKQRASSYEFVAKVKLELGTELIKARILEEDQGGKIPGWDKYGLCLCKVKRKETTGDYPFFSSNSGNAAIPDWNSSPPTPEARMAYYRSVRSSLGTWIPNLEDPEPVISFFYQENAFLLVATDYFTKWVEAEPSKVCLPYQISHSSSSSGFLLAVEAVAVLERVPYSIWFHSTSPLT